MQWVVGYSMEVHVWLLRGPHIVSKLPFLDTSCCVHSVHLAIRDDIQDAIVNDHVNLDITTDIEDPVGSAVRCIQSVQRAVVVLANKEHAVVVDDVGSIDDVALKGDLPGRDSGLRVDGIDMGSLRCRTTVPIPNVDNSVVVRGTTSTLAVENVAPEISASC